MLTTFGVGLITGLVLGIALVVGLLQMTMSTSPKGCFIFFGVLFCLIWWGGGLVLWGLLGD